MPDRIVRAAILTSDRVCALSWPAEVFYRRLMNLVDDYGRYDGRTSVLRSQLYPIQTDKVAERDVGKWLAETAEAGLVTIYSIGEKQYVQLENFGQRLRSPSKWPEPPADKCQQMSADARNCGHPPTSAAVFVCVDVGADVSVGVGDSCSEPSKETASEQPVMVFPCVGKGPAEWPLYSGKLAEYGEAYPGVDVQSECRRALQWIRDNPSKRKTFNGMPRFLNSWIEREQNSGKPSGNGTTNTFGNSRGFGGKVEGPRVRSQGPGSLLDQMDRERQRAEGAAGDSAGGQGKVQPGGSGDGSPGF